MKRNIFVHEDKYFFHENNSMKLYVSWWRRACI